MRRNRVNRGTYIAMFFLGISILVLLFIIASFGFSAYKQKEHSSVETSEYADTESQLEESQITESQIEESQIDGLLADMTLEEKIYQMFIVLPETIATSEEKVTVVDDAYKEQLGLYPVGGIIYMADNLVDTNQTKALLSSTNAYGEEMTGLPLFLCVDEEGGRVARVANNPAFGVTNVGSVGNIKSTTEAYETGAYISSYLKDLGFNFNFAPNADVLTNLDNKVVFDRSFGTDAKTVCEYAIAYANGLHSNEVLSCFKHFPGHGATEGDTHEGYAYTNKTYEELLEQELVPFIGAKEHGIDAIMVAHISVPKVIGDDTPCSLSRIMITDVLRNRIGYDGLVITDALNMGAIAQHYSSAQSAVLAIEAGADVLLMPKDFLEAVNGIKEAVENGTITEERIDASIRRILRVKLSLVEK